MAGDNPNSSAANQDAKTKGPAYLDQCILVEGIDHFTKMKGEKIAKDYQHFGMLKSTAVADNASTLFFNRLTASPGGCTLLERVPKSIFADLKPYVKIFKVMRSSKKKILLPFNDFSNIAEPNRPNLGVSLRSFSYDYLGTNPVEVDYYINCQLNMYFESMDALFKERSSGQGTYSFADLIRRPKGSHKTWDPQAFRIRVEIGYNPPSIERIIHSLKDIKFAGKSIIPNLKKHAKKIRDAIGGSKVLFFLTTKFHSIKPLLESSVGGFEMTIEYNGAVEQQLLTKGANVLAHSIDPVTQEELDRMQENLEASQATLARNNLYNTPEKKANYEKIKSDLEKMENNFPTEYENLMHSVKTREGGHANVDKAMKGAAFRESGHGVGAEAMAPGDKGARQAAYAEWRTKELEKDMRAHVLDNIGPSSDIKSGFGGGGATEEMKKRQAEEMLEHLKKDRAHHTFATAHGATQEQRLADAYSMWVRKLQSKGLIYTYKLDLRGLNEWQTGRSQRQPTLSEGAKKDLTSKRDQTAAGTDTEETLASKVDATRKLEKDSRQQQNIAVGAATLNNILKNAELVSGGKQGSSTVHRKKYTREVEKAVKNTMEGASKKEGAKGFGDPNLLPGPGERKWHLLHWVYLGDLLDATLDFLVSDGKRAKLGLDFWSSTKNPEGSVKILLGDIEFVNPGTGMKQTVNIADIPISLDLWNEFIMEKFVKNLKETRSFKAFLKDMLYYLVKGALTNKCKTPGSPANKSRMSIDYITLPNSSKFAFVRAGAGEDTSYYLLPDVDTATANAMLGVLAVYESRKPATIQTLEGDVMFIYASEPSVGWLKGDKDADARKGICHIVLGQEGTPVLSADFSRADQPFFLEAKAEKAGILSNMEQLSEPYHCNLTLYGNTDLRPGKYIYLRFPWSHVTQGQAQQLGLGGYFFIVKTSNQVSSFGGALEWTTKLEGRWEAPIGGGYETPPVQSLSITEQTSEQSFGDASGILEDTMATSGE